MENNRIITPTHTGIIVSDPAIKAEYLYVGDYGKENNIKADFLGYTKRIEKVEHRPVDIKEKLVVTISTQKGCPMKCNFCDCPKYGFYGNLSTWEMLSEITTAISLSGIFSIISPSNFGEPRHLYFASRSRGLRSVKFL